ncbi:MAG: hypothetical protein B7Z73_04965 [Planctomycetia bacterium 21-64-5]|nr:MAG: hypothetical protein B7Z73_04965 [Planctomycetia bacterium 21-64-5]HQU42278.1 hypothetical protein [Pirellulales bacterium]
MELMVTESSPEIAPGIRQLLAALRRRIRRYVWYEGLAATIAVLGASFWLALGADWFFEPPRAVRYGLLAAMAAAGVASAVWFLLRRILARLSDHSMAILLERRFGNLQDSLVTAVELTSRKEPATEIDEFGRQMLSETCREADRRSRNVQLSAVFNFRPLGRALIASGAILFSLAAAAVASPDMLRFGLRRLTTITDEPWPRNTHLRIEGFDNPQREHVVARGMDFEIHVQADAAPGRVVPQVVEVRYRTDDGKRDRGMMVREGTAAPAENTFQDYRYTFSSVLSGVAFDVAGGDARLRGLRLRVVESPNLGLTLACEYPAYMKRAAAEVPVTGVMPLPVGTRIKVRAHATKNLRQAQIDYLADDAPQTRKFVLDGARDFHFTIDRLASDQTLSFSLLDADGVANRGPIQLAMTAVADEPPQVDVRIEGIGSAITPQARLPLRGRVEDDYGVDRIWLEYTLDDDDPRRSDLASPASRSHVDVDLPFEVAQLELKPGQKLLLGARAADNRAPPAADGPNVAQGERFLLDVVTPDQLLALMETRELNLRQRFETIIQEVTDTRDSLAGLEKAPSEAAEKPPADGEPEAAAETVLQRNLLRVERAEQNNQKNAEETRGVAVAFDDIRAELVNNRVDTEELRIRLKDRISGPLKQIVDVQFAHLGRSLTALKKQLAGGAEHSDAAKSAIEQADLMIVALQKVRDQMLQLESFNEAVDLLREIIAAQQQVSEQTKKERSKKLRELLDDED